jgi:hypothetical protein
VQSRHKFKLRDTLDLAVVGVVGDLAAPTALLLARPSIDGLIPAGVTTTLPRPVAREIAPTSHRIRPLCRTGSAGPAADRRRCRCMGWYQSLPRSVLTVPSTMGFFVTRLD